MVSALAMIIVMLPIIGLTLSNAFSEQLQSALKNELRAYSYSIFSVAEVEEKELIMPEQLLENQFNVIQSGLYAKAVSYSMSEAERRKKALMLWRSHSFIGVSTPNVLPTPNIGDSQFNEMLIENEIHMVYSITVSFGEEEQSFPLTLHIFKNQTEFLAITSEFKQQLWTWLTILIIVFIVVQIIWLQWTLKPLNTLTNELENVEQGNQNSLVHNYPEELEQVTTQLNTLLSTEQNQRKRYRNALSDLAHSLKTPLAIIQSQKSLTAETSEQVTAISQMVEHQLKKAQSAGESAWHLGVPVETTTNKLINTLTKIYRDKAVNITSTIQNKAIFKGDEADLMEILGNLLDNACKAAKSRVELDVSFNPHCLRFTVADDGKGIDESQKNEILKRGTRADTYEKGHGIGLAIVRDLVTSYNGEINIQKSPSLGGALFILTFHLNK